MRSCSKDQIEIGTVVSINLRDEKNGDEKVNQTYGLIDSRGRFTFDAHRGCVWTEESCLVQPQDCLSGTNKKPLNHRWWLERESYKSLNYGMENRDSVCKQFNSRYDAHSTDETI